MEGIFIASIIFTIIILMAIFMSDELILSIITLVITVLIAVATFGMLVFMIDDLFYDNGLFGDRIENQRLEIQEISEEYDSYKAYYISGEKVETIHIPKDKARINISKSYNDKMRLEFRLHYSRYDKVLEDKMNRVTFYLPDDYEIKNKHTIYDVNDLQERRVIRTECVNEIRYEYGKYSFYILEEYLTQFNFQEQQGVKVKFKKGDTKGYKACLNFDYYETFNYDLINKKGHEPVYEIIISDDFDLTTLKR